MNYSVSIDPIDTVTPFGNNPRQITPDAISKVAKSIDLYGFRSPIIVDDDRVILAGHTRLLAAQKLGLSEVPVHVASGLSKSKKRAYRLADNRSAEESRWDFPMLTEELGELMDEGFDLADTLFDPSELANLFPDEPIEGLTDEDEVPEAPEKPVTVEGDVWVLGNHRLMCGDSTSIEALEKLCEGQLVDMWLTDPPYNVAYEGKTKDALTIENDAMGNDDFRQFLRDSYTAADAVMKSGAVFYIWHADSEGYNFRGAAFDIGWQVRQCLIWKKQHMVMGRQDYHWMHEPCLYGWKDGAAHLWSTDRKQTTILEFDRPSRNAEHPTMKPVELFAYQMQNNTKGDDLVLDSFAGSGTTAIACEKYNRRARLMELDPKYCDVIIKRWQDFTGKQAVLLSTDETFDALKEQRCKAA